MVNNLGQWTEEKDYTKYPKEKWCLYDELAVAIRKEQYTIETDMENLINMILSHMQSAIDDGVDIIEDSEVDIIDWVKEQGGLIEFDYYC